MKTSLGNKAFTMIETMIVLAVTGVLFLTSMVFIGDKRQKAEFKQAINDVNQQIDTTINTATTGYYNLPAGIGLDCVLDGSGRITSIDSVPGPENRGSSARCIYIGRAIQYGPSDQPDSPEKFNVYSIAGSRYAVGTIDGEPGNLTESDPIVIVTADDATEYKQTKNGLVVRKMTYVNPAGATATTSGIAFMTNFSESNNNLLESGSRNLSLFAVSGTDFTTDTAGGIGSLDNAANYAPAQSVTICFEGGGNLYGVITVGGGRKQLDTDITYFNKATNPVECV